MGKDKAWLEIAGRPMIEHVLSEARCVTTQITIIANDPRYARLGLPVVADSNRGIGPLEAIRTALVESVEPLALLLACDLPFVTGDLLAFLIDRMAGYEAVAPMSSDSKLQPLCAVYSIHALDRVTELVEAGERRPRVLFKRLRSRIVDFDELGHLGGAERFFLNVNTPDDYARALNAAASGRKKSGALDDID